MKKTRKSTSASSRSRKDSSKGNSRDSFGFGDDKRSRYLADTPNIDFKDHELLRKFMTEQGKIMPRRITGTSSKQQRQLKHAIRRARILGLVR